VRPPDSPRRVLPWLVAVNSLGVVVLAALLVFAFNAIQDSRIAAAEFTCRQTNDRHEGTLRQFETEIRNLPKERQATARENSKGLLRIFEASVPFRPDCAAYARQVATKP
jgi:hypothetical protein